MITGRGCYAKNGEKITVPIRPWLMKKVKAEMDKSDSKWVFVKDDGKTRLKGIRTAFKAAARRAGIPGLRPHDLRHIFAKRLVEESGCNQYTLMQLGGWKSPSMVKRYVGNLSVEHKRNMIDRVADPDFVTQEQTTREQLENEEIVNRVPMKRGRGHRNRVPRKVPPSTGDKS